MGVGGGGGSGGDGGGHGCMRGGCKMGEVYGTFNDGHQKKEEEEEKKQKEGTMR